LGYDDEEMSKLRGENNDFNSFCEWCGGKLPESAEVKSEYVDEAMTVLIQTQI